MRPWRSPVVFFVSIYLSAVLYGMALIHWHGDSDARSSLTAVMCCVTFAQGVWSSNFKWRTE